MAAANYKSEPGMGWDTRPRYSRGVMHGNWLEERDEPPVDRLVAQQDERHLGPVRSRVFDPWATTNHVVHSSLASLTPHAAYDFQRSQAAPSDGYSRERGTRGEWMRDEGHPRAEEWRTSTTYGNSFRGRPSTAPRRYDRHKARWKPEPLDVAPEGRPWVGRRTLSTSLSSTRLMAEMENDNPWQTTNAISFSGALPALNTGPETATAQRFGRTLGFTSSLRQDGALFRGGRF